MTPLRITTELLRANLRHYRSLASTGQRIVITRAGRPECALVPIADLDSLTGEPTIPVPQLGAAKGRIGPYRHMLGRIADAEIAEMAGMSRQGVNWHRRKVGIGVGWK